MTPSSPMSDSTIKIAITAFVSTAVAAIYLATNQSFTLPGRKDGQAGRGAPSDARSRFSIVSVVTGRAPPAGWASFVQNRHCYANLHGYNSFVMCDQNKTFREEKQPPGFAKIWALQRILDETDEGSWVMLLDDDVMIVDMELSLQTLVDAAPLGTEVILPQDHEYSCTFGNYAALLRNGPVTRDLLRMWWEERPKPKSGRLAERMGCGWFDQCPMWRAIIRMLHHTRGKPNHRLPIWDPFADRKPGGDAPTAQMFEDAVRRFVKNCSTPGTDRVGAKPFYFMSMYEFVVQAKWDMAVSYKRCIADNNCPKMFAAHTGFLPGYTAWWTKHVVPAQLKVCGKDEVPDYKLGRLSSHMQCNGFSEPAHVDPKADPQKAPPYVVPRCFCSEEEEEEGVKR